MLAERIEKRLLTKQGFTARVLARRLLGMPEGARVPGVAELAAECGVGYGTVQEAVRLLRETGAVGLRSRGAQGTVLEEVDDEVLWFVANVGHVVGSLPLPYSRRYEGLATGLHALLTDSGIPASLSYMRGGVRRLEALARGSTNFAITSLFTTKVFLDENPGGIEVVMDLGPGSYVVEHQLILADRGGDGLEPGMKVGIDRDSADQARITEMEVAHFGDEVRLMPMTYTQVLNELEAGRLDAAVWNSEDVNGGGFKVVPLESPAAKELSGTNTIAAISVRADDDFSARIVGNKLDRGRLLDVQRAVLDGATVPRY